MCIRDRDIKIKIGSAYPYDGEGAMDVKGRNLLDGLPKNIEIDVYKRQAKPCREPLFGALFAR